MKSALYVASASLLIIRIATHASPAWKIYRDSTIFGDSGGTAKELFKAPAAEPARLSRLEKRVVPCLREGDRVFVSGVLHFGLAAEVHEGAYAS